MLIPKFRLPNRRPVFLIVCLTIFLAGPVEAQAYRSEGCKEELKLNSGDPLGELISKSTFVGLYVARRESPPRSSSLDGTPLDFEALRQLTPEQIEARIRGDDTFADYTLSLSLTLSGTPPHSIDHTPSIDTNDQVPADYFFMNEIHQEIVDRGNVFLGATRVSVDKEGDCFLVPTLVNGYTYLVFGGTLSRLSMEPVLSSRYDPFFKAVLARLGTDN